MSTETADGPKSAAGAESGRHEKLLTEFAAISTARCPSCAYDLRGLAGRHCPECGVRLHLAIIAPTGTFSISWWCALFGAAFTLLMSLRLLSEAGERVHRVLHDPAIVTMVARGFGSAGDVPNWMNIAFAAGWCLLSLIVIAALLASRRRYASMPPLFRVGMGLLGFLMPVMFLGVVYWRIYN
jgi:hypothetical protein